ncbi:TPA: glutamate/gamma-aminobutyrate family transporter YjeM [Klebsiella aerogenes]|uniref:Inner membrane transporter YjeM n=1 Tax=Klebsiella aerogenes (strain ATCC 13048 / DSM 30053 / CCUG 1429 / JCM 1235 / KCTC 2190 / NBRC 13534 / NCIMB 10102 / NCTC 10006 / CDC 819-56) TaxID=1028307 RepID=A0A0H3FQM2_KLEAK|nr:glutamate/gamma-aminobutyrate family transporter YjeM [Klebsiella aerogenes]AEG96768.1 inner membrane transporter YjeM [Klebsiella aerogenes KCTC 2190]KLF41601.1 transporter [Klebsiella aerogenes]MEC4756984.1 glutamate/gamma-aminobutyrate family transporter YjeM [Klebsiella aerogenes]QEU20340.1 glutamate/gamma-aminobutyrate family transporter YjeM [Klebsiella aerogenes]QXB10495.1 glutamate/gamma-aminobutyrate family transporter YjeM [Klebsiella aerogenes]
MPQQIKKMSLIGLILMIFTSVFGFANSPSAFYLMGYSAMPFYLFSALFFFIPFALMMAEMGSAYRKEEGGIYSWMNRSVGPRFAFIGTFMWFSSYVVWMVSTAAKIWVPFSTFLFGADKTQSWAFAGLTSTQTVGVLAACWMVLVTLVAAKGINKIAKITAVGGIAVMCLNLVLLLVSGAILLLNGGHFAQPLDFTASPNPGYQSGLAMLSFVVFAIFAYGGIEAVGGLVDKTEKPEKNFAKGIIIAALVISIGYSLAIVLWGVSANWQQVLSNHSTNLGNITYVLMTSLGATLGQALHLSPQAAALTGVWFARITGLSMFLAYTGAFFTLSYSPLKAIIQGTPKALWPTMMTKVNANGMPANAMWLQCLLVSLFILLVSFGGDTASAFYNKLTLMANVSMTLPYLFLAIAFPFFKAKANLDRPFVMFKSRISTLLATTIVVLVVAFANIFTVIQPVMDSGDWNSTLWMVGGPIFFSLLALGIYENYRQRTAVQVALAEG